MIDCVLRLNVSSIRVSFSRNSSDTGFMNVVFNCENNYIPACGKALTGLMDNCILFSISSAHVSVLALEGFISVHTYCLALATTRILHFTDRSGFNITILTVNSLFVIIAVWGCNYYLKT